MSEANDTTMVVRGTDLQELFRSLTKAIQSLPPDLGRRLHEIRKAYFAASGFEGCHQRMNNRTVAQIFSEYQPVDIEPIASGEVEGVRYTLYPPTERTPKLNER
jgi:hypothetical protein